MDRRIRRKGELRVYPRYDAADRSLARWNVLDHRAARPEYRDRTRHCPFSERRPVLELSGRRLSDRDDQPWSQRLLRRDGQLGCALTARRPKATPAAPAASAR